MARTASSMLALGTKAPNFSLPDVSSGKTVTLDDFSGRKAFLVMFICRHCPYVKHVQKELARLGQDYAAKSLGILAISSNDASAYPDDAPLSLKEMAAELQFNFPFCYDESQDVARTFQAVCTPDYFLFDEQRHLVYRGQLDDSRPRSEKPVTGRDLRDAIEATLNGKPVSSQQVPSLGCSIKWRVAN